MHSRVLPDASVTVKFASYGFCGEGGNVGKVLECARAAISSFIAWVRTNLRRMRTSPSWNVNADTMPSPSKGWVMRWSPKSKLPAPLRSSVPLRSLGMVPCSSSGTVCLADITSEGEHIQFEVPKGAFVNWAMQLLSVSVQRGNAELYSCRRSGLVITREQGMLN